MNAIEDNDLELLEALLDDALVAGEADAVQKRLSAEPALAAALEDLRRRRAMCAAYFNDLQPSDAQAEAFANAAIRGIRRHELFARVTRSAKFIAAAAACVVVGVLISQWRNHSQPTAGKFGPNDPASEQASFHVVLSDNAGNVVAEQDVDKQNLKAAEDFARDLSRWQERQKSVRIRAAAPTADWF